MEIIKNGLTVTLADGAAVAPPYGGPSEHAVGGEDWGGFRERRQGGGGSRGTLRQTHLRRAFGHCWLGEGHIGQQIHLKKTKQLCTERQRYCRQSNIYLNWRKPLQQVLTGCAVGLGSEDLRWAIIACSRSLSFFNCDRAGHRNRSERVAECTACVRWGNDILVWEYF